MEIREILQKNIWEDFLLQCKEKTFLQSWNWGEFQKLMGNKIWRFGIYEKNELISVSLVVKNTARRGTFLLVPHGPVIENSKLQNINYKNQILNMLLNKLKEIAKQEDASFVRMAPIWDRTKENKDIFDKLKFIKSPILIHLDATWELDIRPEEEGLLKNMRKTTRYLIKQAQKNTDIEILKSNNLKDVEKFSELHNKVSVRQKFIPFSLNFLKNEFLAFKGDNEVIMFVAVYKGEIVGSAMIIFNSNKAYYHHSALIGEYSKIPVIYLLIWEAIREAKRRNCVAFDFYGFVDPEKQPKHPWAGPTLFKMGFGGYKKEFINNNDWPITNKYWITYIFERLRKIKRGL